MPLLLIIILLALITESYATAWYSGAIHSKLKEKTPVRLPFALAIIKSLVLAFGIFLGSLVADIVPWIYIISAYALMFIIGLKIALESFRFSPEERIVLIDNTKTLLLLSIAGSFNTFFISISLGLIGLEILAPYLITLILTLVVSIAALYFGSKKGLHPSVRISGIVAGLIIVVISLRFFINHFIGN